MDLITQGSIEVYAIDNFGTGPEFWGTDVDRSFAHEENVKRAIEVIETNGIDYVYATSYGGAILEDILLQGIPLKGAVMNDRISTTKRTREQHDGHFCYFKSTYTQFAIENINVDENVAREVVDLVFPPDKDVAIISKIGSDLGPAFKNVTNLHTLSEKTNLLVTYTRDSLDTIDGTYKNYKTYPESSHFIFIEDGRHQCASDVIDFVHKCESIGE
jgi:esterase/lipase